MVLARSPAGNIEAVENLKKRKLAVYWRPHTDPDGNTAWIQTLPLPADALSKEQYFAKGFRLTKPSDAPEEVVVKDDEKERLYAEIAQLREQLAKKKPGRKKVTSE